MKGWHYISEYIKLSSPWRTSDPIRLIAAGGACAVLLLRNRDRTRNIDFYTPNPSHLEEIHRAKRAAEINADMQDMPLDWLRSAKMISYVENNDGCEHLFANSVSLKEFLFRSEVLEVFAADWRYQLVGKMNRAVQERYNGSESSTRAGDDLSDAIAIIRLMVSRNGGRPIPRQSLITWYFYGPGLEESDIDWINEEYQANYGVVGIT